MINNVQCAQNKIIIGCQFSLLHHKAKKNVHKGKTVKECSAPEIQRNIPRTCKRQSGGHQKIMMQMTMIQTV